MNRIQHAAWGAIAVIAGLIGYGLAGTAPPAMPTTDSASAVRSAPDARGASPVPLAQATARTTGQSPPEDPAAPVPGGGEGPVTVLSLLELSGDFAQTAALYALVSEADLPTLERHIEDARRIPGDADRNAAMSILFLRYADLDPEGVLAYLRRSPVEPKDAAIYSIFSDWAKRDLERAIARLDELAAGQPRQIAVNAILQAHRHDHQRFAALARRLLGEQAAAAGLAAPVILDPDPDRAFAEAIALADQGLRQQALMTLAGTWGTSDPLAALGRAREIPLQQTRQRFRFQVLNAAANHDPDRALRLLPELNRQEGDMLVSTAFGKLAQADPADALRRSRSLERSSWKRAALGTVLSQWSQNQPRAAAQALLAIDDPIALREQGYVVVQHYARIAPREALEWAELAEGHRGQLWRIAVEAYAQQHPGAALAFIARLAPSPLRSDVYASALGALAGTDPARAAELALELPPSLLRTSAVQAVADHWAMRDPASALEWILRLGPTDRAGALARVSHQVASSDWDLALRFAGRLAGRERSNWIQNLVHRYADRDPWEAASWVLDFHDAPEYPDWLGMIAGRLAREDPRAALELVATLPDQERRERAMGTVFHSWADTDPVAAGRWLRRQHPDSSPGGAYAQVVRRWCRFDPAAAERWTLSLPTGGPRDEALSALVTQTTLEDPPRLGRLLDQFSDEGLRSQAIFQIANQLIQVAGREAAEAFVLDLSMPEATREQVLQQLANGQGY